MKLNFIGVAQSLIAVENTERTWMQRLFEDGEPVALGGLVFTLAITQRGGVPQFFALQVQEDAVLWRIPALPRGDYEYDLWVQDDEGSRTRMFYGHLEVVPSAAVEQVAELSHAPVLETFLGGKGGLRWQWMAGTAAAFYAQQAAQSAREAGAAGEQVAEALRDLPSLRAFMELFRSEVARAIRIADGVWVIGDTVTGYPAQGPRGEKGLDGAALKRVEVASVADLPTDAEHTSGHYVYYVPSGVRATGYVYGNGTEWMAHYIVIYVGEDRFSADNAQQVVDMINAQSPVVYAQIVAGRILITAREAGENGNSIYLHAEGDTGVTESNTHLVGGVDGDGYDVYVWGQSITGEEAWLNLGNADNVQLATTEVPGVMMFSSPQQTDFGAGIHRDVEGRARVDDATTMVKGAVRLTASGDDEDFEECIGNTPARVVGGRNLGKGIGVFRATASRAGVLRRAAALAAGDDGAASGEQVAEALRSKQDTLDFEDPDSPISRLVADAVQNAVQAAVAGLALPKVGDVVLNFSPIAPAGYVPMNGQRLPRTGAYAALFAYFAANGVTTSDGTPIASSGDGATTFEMPDATGCFMRLIGEGRNLNRGRKAGSFEVAAVPNLYGSLAVLGLTTAAETAAHEETGAFGVAPSRFGYAAQPTFGTPYAVHFDASRIASVYRNGVQEVRPSNMALYAYVKY